VDRDADILPLIGMLAIAAAVVWFIDIKGLWNDELILYPVRCSVAETNKDPLHCDEIFIESRTRYIVNTTVNEVSYAYLVNPDPARKLVRCAILDTEHWSCTYPDEAGGQMQIIDGLKVRNRLEANMGYAYVHKWQWHAINLGLPLPRSWLVPEQKGANY